MAYQKFSLAFIACISLLLSSAQVKKVTTVKNSLPGKDSMVIPISNADLGSFPYLKTLQNFYSNDSLTLENNRVYFFDGKKYFTIDGKVSAQNLNIKNSDQKIASEFECIREFDKVIATLGGVKIYTGKLPEEPLKAIAGEDLVTLGSKSQVAPSAFYGVVEYVIKTPEKEVWIQLQPYSLVSKFYTLLVVEKMVPLVTLNTNRHNQIAEDLEKNKKAIFYLSFEPDKATIQPASKDQLLSLLGVFQSHPDWKLTIESYNAPVGPPAYTAALTEGRAATIKQELVNLGVNSSSISTKGMGDQKPIASNDTEQGRLTNTRFEITLQ